MRLRPSSAVLRASPPPLRQQPAAAVAGLLIALAVLCAVAGCGRQRPPPPRLALLCVGDSLTAQGIYPRAVAAALERSGRWSGVDLAVCGVGGATPARLRQSIEAGTLEIPRTDRGEALVLAGTNAYAESDVIGLARAVAGRGWSVTVLATPPRRPARPGAGYGSPQANRDFNRRLRLLVAPPLRWIDARDALREPGTAAAAGDLLDPALAEDATHPNRAGYERFGTAVAAAMLAEPPR